MPNKNSGLNRASKAKKDEFYTRLEDIERELWHYEDYFRGKTIFCNCDDPFESNFFKHFAMNFNRYGLRKLIATCYDGSPVAEDLAAMENGQRKAFKVELTSVSDVNGDGAIDLNDVESLLRSRKTPVTCLEGNGDFRSEECLKLMEEADIVVTNPPFSLFREYVATLMEHNKKFIIIGNQNAITYKEVFPHIKNNEIWLGYGFKRNCAHFINRFYADTATDLDHKEGMIRVSGVMWFTNLDTKKRHDMIDLWQHYSPEKFPHYDNYDAIEVGKAANIPMDYDGVMGVPITFMDKYNPEQFEIVGATESEGKGFSCGLWDESSGVAQATVNGQKKYKRIFIRRRGK